MIARQLASIFLILFGGIFLVGGILERYADRNLLDPERFAERAVGALDDAGARSEIADVIVNQLEREGADREEAQSAVDRNIEAVAEDERFRSALAAALVAANEQALSEDRDHVGVVMADVGTPLRQIFGEQEPDLAELIPADIDLRVANTGATGTLVDVARKADGLSELATVLPILGILMVIGGVAVANDRRTALFGAAMGVALSGAAIFAGYVGGREIAARQPDDDAAQDAARAIWDAVFGGLETLGLVMAAVGAAVALVAGLSAVAIRGRDRGLA